MTTAPTTSRTGGQIRLTLILPHGAHAPEATRHPAPLLLTAAPAAAQQAGYFVELRRYLDDCWLGDDAEVLGDTELGLEFRQ